jgi:hypothetical protein
MSQGADSNQRGTLSVPSMRSARPGAGETMIHVRVTLEQREKFALLGAGQWLRTMIDAAPRQPKVYTGEDRIMSMLMRIPGSMNSCRPPRDADAGV